MVPVVHTITVCFRDLCLQLTPTNSTYLLHTRVSTALQRNYQIWTKIFLNLMLFVLWEHRSVFLDIQRFSEKAMEI